MPERGPPWLRAIEKTLGWLFAYPLIPLQILLFWLISWGRLGYEAGADDLFWSESAREQIFNGLTCGLLFAELLVVRYLLLDPRRRPFDFRFSLLPVSDPAVRRLGSYLLVFWIPSLVVLGVFKLFSDDVKFSDEKEENRVPVWPLYVGLALSVGVGSAVIAFAGRLRRAASGADREATLHTVAAVTALLYLVVLGILYVRHAMGAVLSPVVVLCVLLGFLSAVYGFVVYRTPGLQHVVLVVLVAAGVGANARWANPNAPYKLTLPGLESYYASPLRLDEDPPTRDQNGNRRRLDHYYDLLQRQQDGKAPKPDLIPSTEPLRRMKERWQKVPGQEKSKPRIVLVCTSGGGIRAAVWTAVVMEGLERELGPKFRDHVRMFTGASGGMVGAGLYVAEFEDTPAGQQPIDTDTKLGGLSGKLAQDSLRRTLQTMVLQDLPSVWWPGGVGHDRGRELERVWAGKMLRPDGTSGFRRPFSDLHEMEKDGRRPSLVFSPMMVEDARRLLVSNLDLMPLSVASGPVVNFQPDKKTGQHPFPGAPDRPMLSVSGVELFRLFPAAQKTFQVGTAARVNASFPFLSPGVSLPTDPPRRVVDAGYYDNYGVNLAAVWLAKNRDAIREHTSGVVVVEIRAYRNGYARWHFQDKEKEHKEPNGPKEANGPPAEDGESSDRRGRGAVATALEGLLTPAEAISAMRARAAYHRNDELLDWLDREFNGPYENGVPKGVKPGDEFFTTVAFECQVDAALSWTLPKAEARRIAESFYENPANRKMRGWIESRVNATKAWFGTGGK